MSQCPSVVQCPNFAHWITEIRVYKKFNNGYFKDTPLKIDQTFIPFFSSYMLIPCSLLLLSGIWLLHCCSQCAHALNRILNSDTEDTSLQETKYNIVNFRRDKKLSSASIVHHYWGTVEIQVLLRLWDDLVRCQSDRTACAALCVSEQWVLCCLAAGLGRGPEQALLCAGLGQEG